MKKYFVIGNPISHSLSPKLHNYWIKKNRIDAVYEKKKINKIDIKNIINQIREGTIDGLNVTVPFKQAVIPFLDNLTLEAEETKSVNTIYKEGNKVFGHNTDIGGFELALRNINYDVKNKIVFILGAGGVVPSIIVALKRMKVSKIILTNRTLDKAKDLKKINSEIEILEWGKISNFDLIINATSLGLKKEDEIKLNYNKIGPGKLFYDVIYNPKETNFLMNAKKFGNYTENGKMMFIYQAHQAFTVWHKIMPSIDQKTIDFID